MKIIFLLLLLSALTLAQDSNSLRQKYGTPDSETFKVRPEILLTVTYAKTGEVCSMLIEPQTFWVGATKLDHKALIKGELLDEILEELAPKKQRGKFRVASPQAGGVMESYERVFVHRSGEINKWRAAVILWRIKGCEN
jgi:hypothetical protein